MAGELRVTEKPREVSRASGEIRVAGTYEAFGRKLTIERGRLQYAGTALDDPQLDILAERKLQDVTAKLRVTGTAQQPQARRVHGSGDVPDRRHVLSTDRQAGERPAW